MLPVIGRDDRLIGVLDIDSDRPDAFDQRDADALSAMLAQVFGQL